MTGGVNTIGALFTGTEIVVEELVEVLVEDVLNVVGVVGIGA